MEYLQCTSNTETHNHSERFTHAIKVWKGMPFLLPSCDLLPELMKAAFMSFFTLSLHLSYFMLYIVNISRELMGQNKVLFINNLICRLKTGLEQFYKTVDLALIASLEPSARSRNIAGLSLFCKYYFGNVQLNWLNWFHKNSWFFGHYPYML